MQYRELLSEIQIAEHNKVTNNSSMKAPRFIINYRGKKTPNPSSGFFLSESERQKNVVAP